MKKKFIVTVDLGGTKILTALLNKKKEIVARVKTPTDATKGEVSLVKDIANSVTECLKKAEVKEKDVNAISMGVPGTVNPDTGIIGVAPNLGIKNFNIKNALQEYFSIPVLIENDVNLAALGIKKFEYDEKVKNMLVVFIGTGIGAGIIFNGMMYRGSSMYAGEIGHMHISPSGAVSSNSEDPTFENTASRTAIVKKLIAEIEGGTDSVLSETLAKGKPIKSGVLRKAVAAKDELVIKELSAACKVIGNVLGNITTLLNFDTIVLGGGVVAAMDEFMLPKINAGFKSSVLSEPGKIVKIVSTKLGDDAALYGGISLAEEFVK